ncbi:MAG: Amidohydro-rel protein, partial [Acidobacteria bacterium]|nr:Amidohydro-rel protein [Acidobacteriota bacterium]
MRRQDWFSQEWFRMTVGFFVAIVVAAGAGTPLWSQERDRPPDPSPYLAPRTQVVAVRAGRLFDARSGTMLN